MVAEADADRQYLYRVGSGISQRGIRFINTMQHQQTQTQTQDMRSSADRRQEGSADDESPLDPTTSTN